jgi:hypothetical protein
MVKGGTSNFWEKKIGGKKKDTNTALHGNRRHLKLFGEKNSRKKTKKKQIPTQLCMVIGGTSNSLGKKIVGKKQKKTDTNTALHGNRRHLKLFGKKNSRKKTKKNRYQHSSAW